MRERSHAEELGRVLVELARSLGLKADALLSDMDQPLGHAVGNALEVREAIETLAGGGPEDLRDLCVAVAGRMIAMGAGLKIDEGRRQAARALEDGSALERFGAWVAAQGGDARVAEHPGLLPRAPVIRTVSATESGIVVGLDALEVGRAAMSLGAGRRQKDDAIDARVGVICMVKVGDAVTCGEPMAEVHAADDATAREAASRLVGAWTVSTRAKAGRRPVVLMDPLGEA